MAMTYEEILRRLGRRVVVQVDKRRGTEIRRAPGEAGEAGDIQVRYRGTPVVTLHPDHTYTLRTGGLATRTVRNRIAEYSPVSLVHRGGGYFIEDVRTGTLVPFLEGVRVGPDGRPIEGPAVPATTGRTTSLGENGRGSGQQIDEAQLRSFIRALVADALRDFGVPPRPVQAVPNLRPGKLRGRVRDLDPDAAVLPLDVVEQMMLDAGATPEKVKRVLRDTRNSLFRGRDKADDYDEPVVPEQPILRKPPASIGALGDCADCGLNIAAHYDRANRFRGCNYAAEHREDVGLV
jgi:hypothetical protein